MSEKGLHLFFPPYTQAVQQAPVLPVRHQGRPGAGVQGLGQDTRARDGREGTRGGRGTEYFEKRARVNSCL